MMMGLCWAIQKCIVLAAVLGMEHPEGKKQVSLVRVFCEGMQGFEGLDINSPGAGNLCTEYRGTQA